VSRKLAAKLSRDLSGDPAPIAFDGHFFAYLMHCFYLEITNMHTPLHLGFLEPDEPNAPFLARTTIKIGLSGFGI
jgi:hypothetical protein